MMYKIWSSNLVTPEYHIGANYDAPPTFQLKDLGFDKQEITKFGLKKSLIFYDGYDEASDKYKDPLLAISWQTIFENGTPKKQIRRTSWMLDDGKWSQSHESIQQVREPKLFLQKMRSRVIEELIDLADKFGLGERLKALYEENATEIYIYKEGGSPKFRDAIASSTEEWLERDSTDGRTVRDVILDYLAIGMVSDVVD